MTRIDLLSNPMTTAEDIIVGGASGVPGRLAAGSEGDVLSIASGAVAWSAPAGAASGLVIGRAKARHSTTQNATTGTKTALLFDEEVYDSGTIHSIASNTSRFVAPTGTVWVQADAYITVPTSINSTRNQIQGFFRIDGTTEIDPYTRSINEASGGSILTMHVSGRFEISAASYLEVCVLQATGGTYAFGHATDNANNRMEVVFYN